MIKQKIEKKLLKFKDKIVDYDEVIWLIGDGRSGTTWVSDLINYKNQHRVIFEPFHPDRIKQLSSYEKNAYMNAETNDDNLRAYYGNVFRGRVYDDWTNREHNGICFRHLLIKDIFSNLMASWIHKNFSHVKIINLIRNPYSVALSKVKLRDWQWQESSLSMFADEILVKEHIKPFCELREEVATKECFATEQFFIWCLINYVFLRTKPKNAKTIYYEEVTSDYKTLYFALGQEAPDIESEYLNKPSSVSLCRVDSTKETPEQKWINIYGQASFDFTQTLITQFNLSEIYTRTKVQG